MVDQPRFRPGQQVPQTPTRTALMGGRPPCTSSDISKPPVGRMHGWS
jgi:hypothetical protein